MRSTQGLIVAALAVPGAAAAAAFPPEVTELMDTSADPCDDFYQYACGGWIRNFTLPPDRQSYAFSFNGVSDRNEPVIQDIIDQDWPLVGELWDSCMNLDNLLVQGNMPLQFDLEQISAASTKEDLARVAGALGGTGPSLFTGIGVDTDIYDAKTNVLYGGSASLLLPDLSLYRDDKTFTAVELPLRQYISSISRLSGISVNSQILRESNKTVDDVVIDVELAFARILIESEGASKYDSLSLMDAETRYPLAFRPLVEGAMLRNRSRISDDSVVRFNSLDFMDRAEKLFRSANLDELKVYYSVLYVDAFAPYLGEPFLEAVFDLYGKTLQGLSSRSLRKRVCTAALTTLLPDLIGKYYFLKMFDKERERNVQRIIVAIEQAMSDHIAKLTWLDDKTRAEAAIKLSKVVNLIGQSTQKKNYPFVLSRDNYMRNVQLIKQHAVIEAFAKIGSPVDRSTWSMSAATVNAYYLPSQNKMVFPAAILQPPFFNGGSHPAQNFGAIGAVIGHELTHGFDNTGRAYDGDGNRRTWWTTETAEEFDERATCLKKQYSKIPAFGDSGKMIGYVDGNLTINENIADNGGVTLAFDAYQNWLRSDPSFDLHGVTPEDARRLFFISYAQVWCGKITDSTQQQLLSTDEHAPKPARVIGAAMNSADFASTFQCEAGAKMNPLEKCKLW